MTSWQQWLSLELFRSTDLPLSRVVGPGMLESRQWMVGRAAMPAASSVRTSDKMALWDLSNAFCKLGSYPTLYWAEMFRVERTVLELHFICLF